MTTVPILDPLTIAMKKKTKLKKARSAADTAAGLILFRMNSGEPLKLQLAEDKKLKLSSSSSYGR